MRKQSDNMVCFSDWMNESRWLCNLTMWTRLYYDHSIAMTNLHDRLKLLMSKYGFSDLTFELNCIIIKLNRKISGIICFTVIFIYDMWIQKLNETKSNEIYLVVESILIYKSLVWQEQDWYLSKCSDLMRCQPKIYLNL